MEVWNFSSGRRNSVWNTKTSRLATTTSNLQFTKGSILDLPTDSNLTTSMFADNTSVLSTPILRLHQNIYIEKVFLKVRVSAWAKEGLVALSKTTELRQVVNQWCNNPPTEWGEVSLYAPGYREETSRQKYCNSTGNKNMHWLLNEVSNLQFEYKHLF